LWAFKMDSFRWLQPVSQREVHDQSKWARQLLCGSMDEVKQRGLGMDSAIQNVATDAKLAKRKQKVAR